VAAPIRRFQPREAQDLFALLLWNFEIVEEKVGYLPGRAALARFYLAYGSRGTTCKLG
jgi:hypothetical protein